MNTYTANLFLLVGSHLECVYATDYLHNLRPTEFLTLWHFQLLTRRTLQSVVKIYKIFGCHENSLFYARPSFPVSFSLCLSFARVLSLCLCQSIFLLGSSEKFSVPHQQFKLKENWTKNHMIMLEFWHSQQSALNWIVSDRNFTTYPTTMHTQNESRSEPHRLFFFYYFSFQWEIWIISLWQAFWFVHHFHSYSNRH